MVVYTWKITNLDIVFNSNSLTNVVTRIHWRLVGSKDNATSEVYGVLDLGDPDPTTFTDFESLTQEQVTEWIEASFNTELLEHYKQLIAAAIEEKITPTKRTMLPPWE